MFYMFYKFSLLNKYLYCIIRPQIQSSMLSVKYFSYRKYLKFSRLHAVNPDPLLSWSPSFQGALMQILSSNIYFESTPRCTSISQKQESRQAKLYKKKIVQQYLWNHGTIEFGLDSPSPIENQNFHFWELNGELKITNNNLKQLKLSK